MRQEELRRILGRMSFEISNFDSYKVHRFAFREFASYLREMYPPQNDFDPFFSERENTLQDIVMFQPLYYDYAKTVRENTGEQLPFLALNLKPNRPVNDNLG